MGLLISYDDFILFGICFLIHSDDTQPAPFFVVDLLLLMVRGQRAALILIALWVNHRSML